MIASLIFFVRERSRNRQFYVIVKSYEEILNDVIFQAENIEIH